MNAITLGHPNLFLKGIAERMIFDPATGNVIGYDNVPSEGASASSVNMGAIEGGLGNPTIINIPDSAKLTGTATSQAFSLQQRRLISGGSLEYNAPAPVCETIEATSASISVSKVPCLAPGEPAGDEAFWCRIKEHGSESYQASNVGVKPDKQINFTAISGKKYDVFYFTKLASAQILDIPSIFIPPVVTIMTKFAIYRKQNGGAASGTLAGFVYEVIPRAQFTGNIGIDGSQTANATTDYAWEALAYDEADLDCHDDCVARASALGYYIYVPCDGAYSAVEALAVLGGGVSVAVGADIQIPVVFVMKDGATATPVYADLQYASSDAATATVADGVVHGVAAGAAEITISLADPALSTVCNVTVI